MNVVGFYLQPTYCIFKGFSSEIKVVLTKLYWKDHM